MLLGLGPIQFLILCVAIYLIFLRLCISCIALFRDIIQCTQRQKSHYKPYVLHLPRKDPYDYDITPGDTTESISETTAITIRTIDLTPSDASSLSTYNSLSTTTTSSSFLADTPVELSLSYRYHNSHLPSHTKITQT